MSGTADLQSTDVVPSERYYSVLHPKAAFIASQQFRPDRSLGDSQVYSVRRLGEGDVLT